MAELEKIYHFYHYTICWKNADRKYSNNV